MNFPSIPNLRSIPEILSEGVEANLKSGTAFAYPVVVGLARMNTGTIFSKSGVMIVNGFWSAEANYNDFNTSLANTTTSAAYEDMITEDFVLPISVRTVSGHAFTMIYCVLSATVGTTVVGRTKAQLFKIDSSGNFTLLGTSDTSAEFTHSVGGDVSKYFIAFPYTGEIDLDENERIGLRIIVQGKRTAGAATPSITLHYHSVSSPNVNKRTHALLPIKR